MMGGKVEKMALSKEERKKRNEYQREWRKKHPEYRDYMREWQIKNRDKRNMQQRERFAKNPEKYRAIYKKKSLEWNYGLNLEDYNTMLVEQGDCCAICKSDNPGVKNRGWHVDHDHITGDVRGLLCHKCNHLLGNARDNPEILTAAIQYLIKKEGK